MLHVFWKGHTNLCDNDASIEKIKKEKRRVRKESLGVYVINVPHLSEKCAHKICDYMKRCLCISCLSIACRERKAYLERIVAEYRPTSVSVECVKIVDIDNVRLDTVAYLALVDVGISKLPTAFEVNSLVNLKTLDLSSNDFSTVVQADLSGMSSLQAVVLCNCRLRNIPKFCCGGGQKNLVKIDISRNMITSPALGWGRGGSSAQIFPDSVRQLHLNDNHMQEFPDIPLDVEQLYVSNNPASKLSQPISWFKKLKYLSSSLLHNQTE